ncbi:poly-gamma-glutamate synthesis protein (capsule biosynthesis protein) [Aquimarina amphilecti]|uniref:Poly-gamma-glutamate synthesis protein (Capsule biosynthesis protein) n=1 Tax=Aquimarina amphilecti TaxID=1038014 RepID=A0A1H7PHN1_AQUAM|nr:poly-gamma-glutamate synthesis protein (capsule biosynthesis protein) [Aquimarina amphilecti]
MLLVVFSCDTFGSRTNETSVVFVGDLLLDRGVRNRIEHLGMNSLFHSSINSVFESSDIVIANLECPATAIKEPINKKFIFRAEPSWLMSLKDQGITHLNMANNHSMDQGRNGLVDTNKNIVNSGLISLGYGVNTEKACQPQLIATAPRNIYVFSSLQVPSENWTFLENKPCVCEDSFETISDKIKKLKIEEPNSVVIIQLHWGAEHTMVPLTYQKQQAYQLIDSGADGIIGHHPHTIQTVELYKQKPIYYSIGNFIFDQNKPINSKGLLVKLKVNKTDVVFDHSEFTIEKCTPKIL